MLKEAIGRVAKVDTNVAVSALCQQVNAYGVDIEVAAQVLALSQIGYFRFNSVTYFGFETKGEEQGAASLSELLLPFHRHRDAEVEIAKAALRIGSVVYIARGYFGDAVRVFIEGVVTVYTERGVSPAQSGSQSPTTVAGERESAIKESETDVPGFASF